MFADLLDRCASWLEGYGRGIDVVSGDTDPERSRTEETLATAASDAAILLPGRRPRRRLRKRMVLHIQGYRTLAINLSAICVIAVVLVVVSRETLRDKVEVEPIDVPRDLEDAGYTPKVIAERLVDGVVRIEAAAKTTMGRRGLVRIARPIGTDDSRRLSQVAVRFSPRLFTYGKIDGRSISKSGRRPCPLPLHAATGRHSETPLHNALEPA